MGEPVVVVWGMAVGCSCVPRGARHGGDIPEGIGDIGRLGGWLRMAKNRRRLVSARLTALRPRPCSSRYMRFKTARRLGNQVA